jgi:hypothetical protein
VVQDPDIKDIKPAAKVKVLSKQRKTKTIKEKDLDKTIDKDKTDWGCADS